MLVANFVRRGDSFMLQPAQSAVVFRFGCFEFDFEAGELRKRGLKLRLLGQPRAGAANPPRTCGRARNSRTD